VVFHRYFKALKIVFFALGSSLGIRLFVGWVERHLVYVGFRFTLPNLQFAHTALGRNPTMADVGTKPYFFNLRSFP
jgi:hypothetical protein